MKTLDWFKERIGKRIYRDSNHCGRSDPCKDCADVTENGLVVQDEQHAEYLYAVHNDYQWLELNKK